MWGSLTAALQEASSQATKLSEEATERLRAAGLDSSLVRCVRTAHVVTCVSRTRALSARALRAN